VTHLVIIAEAQAAGHREWAFPRRANDILRVSSGEFKYLPEVHPVPKRARTLKSKSIYRGRIVELKLDHIIEPGGVETTREIIYHPGSVVVIPHLPGGKLILVRQFRYAAQDSLWELVAGGLEKGERPIQGARRELIEEAGFRARRLKTVLDFYPSPGILSEKMHLVEAWDLTPAKGVPDEDERIEVGIFTLDEVARMIENRKIHDGKTLVGILWLMSRGKPLT
jgi:ADP-ribose pyrophosphatase